MKNKDGSLFEYIHLAGDTTHVYVTSEARNSVTWMGWTWGCMGVIIYKKGGRED